MGGRRFDLLIAANVLHATCDLRQTLRHVRSLLAPGGRLVLVEATQPEAWGELTFGLTAGWWRLRSALRRDQPLVDVAGWQALLAAAGFDRHEVLPQAGGEAIHQHVLVARADRRRSEPSAAVIRPMTARPPAARPHEVAAGSSLARPVEAVVGQVLAEVLHAPAIDRDRSFQELGIDSLLALEVIGRLKSRLKIARLVPPVLFEHPSLERLAAYLWPAATRRN